MNEVERQAVDELAEQRAQIGALSAQRRAERLAAAREREEQLFNQPGIIDRLLAGLGHKPSRPEPTPGSNDREAA
jgi:hypothetical protein